MVSVKKTALLIIKLIMKRSLITHNFKDEKMIRILLYLTFLLLILTSCESQVKEKLVENDKTKIVELPNGAHRLIYDKHIYIPITFDKIKGNFVFDTGADQLYFDSVFYHNNNFKNNKIVNGILPGAGLNKQRVKVILDTVRFSLEEESFRSDITPIIKLKPILGDLADGILGNKLLDESIFELSYDKEYINIHASLDSINLSGFQKIKLEKVANRFYLPLSIKINDSLLVKGNLLLDLGSGGTITFTNHTAQQYDFKNNIGDKTFYYTEYGGLGGKSSSFKFKADSVRIGGHVLKKMVLEYSNDESGALSKRNFLGIMGNQILEKFDIIIDNINHSLYLKPNSFYQKPFTLSSYGFRCIDRSKTLGAWIITGLSQGSNAEKAGLKIEDKIIEINGMRIDSLNFKQKDDFFEKSDSLELLINRENRPKRKITFVL